jgi:hypothetical protein
MAWQRANPRGWPLPIHLDLPFFWRGLNEHCPSLPVDMLDRPSLSSQQQN